MSQKTLKIGLIREGKVPPDKRVAFLPEQCQRIAELYPNVSLVVQSSPIRCVPDSAYSQLGIEVKEDLSDCDILFGIKEVPISQLIPNKTYLFFSHTLKKQPYNRQLLQTILEKNITLIDYEVLVDQNGNRIVAFGLFAGIVGAYNGIRAYGKRFGLFDIKPVHACSDRHEMRAEYKHIALPPIKILLTGTGRVGKGAKIVLDELGIKQVTPQAFLSQTFPEPVYTQLSSGDYYQRLDGAAWDSAYFHANPASVHSNFNQYAQVADLFISATYWHPDSPPLFTSDQVKSHDFKIKVIADITCDINGSIPCTRRASTIFEPYYDYVPETGMITPPFTGAENITVMAVDNLPCELPYDASEYFGNLLCKNVLPHLLGHDTEQVIARATIAHAGKLMPRFQYLTDYV